MTQPGEGKKPARKRNRPLPVEPEVACPDGRDARPLQMTLRPDHLLLLEPEELPDEPPMDEPVDELLGLLVPMLLLEPELEGLVDELDEGLLDEPLVLPELPEVLDVSELPEAPAEPEEPDDAGTQPIAAVEDDGEALLDGEVLLLAEPPLAVEPAAPAPADAAPGEVERTYPGGQSTPAEADEPLVPALPLEPEVLPEAPPLVDPAVPLPEAPVLPAEPDEDVSLAPALPDEPLEPLEPELPDEPLEPELPIEPDEPLEPDELSLALGEELEAPELGAVVVVVVDAPAALGAVVVVVVALVPDELGDAAPEDDEDWAIAKPAELRSAISRADENFFIFPPLKFGSD